MSLESIIDSVLDKLPFVKGTFDVHMREVVSGASVAFLLRLLGGVFAFSFSVLLTRILGADGTGLYFLAFMVAMIVMVFGKVGLDIVVMRHVAAGVSVGDWSEVKGVYRKGFILSLIASSISSIVMFIAAPYLATFVFNKPELTWPLRIMSFAIIPMALVAFHVEALKGLKRITDAMTVNWIGVPVLSILGVYLLGKRWGVSGAVFAYFIAVVVMAFIGWILWKRATPQLRSVKGQFATSYMIRSATPLFWTELMRMVITWTSTLFLGVWSTSSDVGIFGVANRTAILMSLVLVAVNAISAPKFAELYRKGDINALTKTARHSLRLMVCLNLPPLLVFLFAPAWIMSFFGPGFEQGAWILIILAIGQFLNVATGSAGYMLLMTGNEKAQRNNVAFNMILNLILCAVLIPLFGILGAAVATAVSMASIGLTAMMLVSRHLSIKMWRYI